MDANTKGARGKRTEHTGILQKRGHSGVCVYYWQKKLSEAASRELAVRGDCLPEGASAPKGWAICKAKETKAATAAVTIEIGQYRIVVERGTDEDTLATVVRVLTALC